MRPAEPRKTSKSKALVLGAAVATLLAALTYQWGVQRLERKMANPPAVTAQAPTPAPDPSVPLANAPVVEPEESASAEAAAALEGAEPTEDAASGPRRHVISAGRQAGLHRVKDPLRLVASAAVVVDADKGTLIYAKNEAAVLPIASLTKLMTALIVTEGKLDMDETLTITEEDVDRQRNSRSRLRVGTKLTRGEALHLALMSSENRAAHALGRTFPGGLPRFVQLMNSRARQLGMNNTSFVDPTGLSSQNQSTARDVALLAGAAAKNPLVRDYSTTPQHQVALGGRKLQYLNSNRLVRNAGWDIELQKTGYILEAGQCLTMLTKVGGEEVIMVLLDSTDKGSRSADAQRLRKFVTTRASAPESMAVAKPREAKT